MNALFHPAVRAATASLCALVLTACGGGAEQAAALPSLDAQTTQAIQPDAAHEDVRRQALGTPLNADGPATTLTVRAHGRLAGNVGPLMQVWVEGVLIDTVEVRATEPTDYNFSVPVMQAGRRVDVAYINDATVDQVNRDLFVSYLIAGDTFVLPTHEGVSYDRGVGSAAFDGIDVITGRIAMSWNGALRFNWPEPNLNDVLTVRASGTLAGGVGPVLALRVDGVTVGRTEVRSTEGTDHVFAVPRLVANSRVDVVYTNDAVVGSENRNLFVAQLLTADTLVLPTQAGAVYDLGAGEAAFDGANTLPGQPNLHSNGALRFKWPAPNLHDRITVRASTTLAADIGANMEVRVDGKVVGSTEVRATTPTDHSFAVFPVLAGMRVDVRFTNDAVVAGEDRNLYVHYVIADRTYIKPTAPGVIYDRGPGEQAFDGIDVLPGQERLGGNGALRFEWPTPNLTSSLTVRARASLAAGVGPIMQLHVDGVVLGNSEVRSTDYADYHFVVPALNPGARVDLIYTNDGRVNEEDRNLFVDYLISGSTFVRASDAGVEYDRGVGERALDGFDVLPGQSAMYWGGALRARWPAPNVTDTVIVRASGSLAGNTGPIMLLRVDGVAVSSVEVRSASATDHHLASPPLRAGSKVDVVFTNDVVIDGEDRNLTVAYLLKGNTYLLPTAPGVVYDVGQGAAAFDGVDTHPGRDTMNVNGALRATWPGPNLTNSLTVRASASLAADIGALMQVRVNGVIVGTTEVRSTSPADHTFQVPGVAPGSRVDIAFINDQNVGGEDRNLFVHYVDLGAQILVASAPGVTLDFGPGEAAFDGVNVAPGSSALYNNSALRFVVPDQPSNAGATHQRYAASRFLQQATFGPTMAEVDRLTSTSYGAWLTEQIALPPSDDFVAYVQGKFNLGHEYRPKGTNYTTTWAGQQFWASAATSEAQLRKRVAYALHQIFTISQLDSNLNHHSRAYASYLDKLNRHAFSNFRVLLEEMALSPAMGLYLSHMRNRPENPDTGRQPDENFARELMQLFTIGLHELNQDGTVKLGTNGQPIETYDNEDVMALAKVFTGWSWAFADDQLTEHNFRYGNPDYTAANDQGIDLLPMKPYPGQHSAAEKRLFSGTAQATVIPAHTTARESVRLALDALFQHPNVGPFIGRQLIQRMVTSHPSPAYVARVAARFNDNGAGKRGDMGAVVRAILMDSEARTPPAGAIGKVREPVLRVAHWMRSFSATSASGDYMMANELGTLSQRVLHAPSVFGYFRPGYVPPNTVFSAGGITVPELQIVNESTTASWVNTAFSMAGTGLGWTGTARDVASNLQDLVSLSTAGDVDGLIERINLLLFAGTLSAELRQEMLDAMTSIAGSTAASHQNRARIALFLALASTEYLVQK